MAPLMRSSTHKRLNLWVGVSHYSLNYSIFVTLCICIFVYLCLWVFVCLCICVFLYLCLSLMTLFIFLPLLIHRPLFAFLVPILWLGSFLQKSKEERWKSEIWDTVFWRGTQGISVFFPSLRDIDDNQSTARYIDDNQSSKIQRAGQNSEYIRNKIQIQIQIQIKIQIQIWLCPVAGSKSCNGPSCQSVSQHSSSSALLLQGREILLQGREILLQGREILLQGPVSKVWFRYKRISEYIRW